MSDRSLLTVNDIEVIYDHVILGLKGVSLRVPKGGIVTLLEANGAISENEDVKELYLGLSGVGHRRSYRSVKHYRRRKRWLS